MFDCWLIKKIYQKISASAISCCSIVTMYIKISSAIFITPSVSARMVYNVCCNFSSALCTPNIKRLYCLTKFSVVVYLDSSSNSSWWKADLRSNFIKCFYQDIVKCRYWVLGSLYSFVGTPHVNTNPNVIVIFVYGY